MTPSTIPSATLGAPVPPLKPTVANRSKTHLRDLCEFCQSQQADVCMSCLEAARSQAPDAGYCLLVQAAQSLLERVDALAPGTLGPAEREVAALRAVMGEIY